MRTISFEHRGAVLSAVDSRTPEKRVVLTIHGGLADHRSGLRFAEPIAATTRVIAPDLRGAGRSYFAGALSWELLTSDLVALLDRLELDRVVVIGSSMGSGVALRLALDAPERVAGLVLVSPMYLGSDSDLTPAQQEALDRMAAFGALAEREGIEALLPIYDALPPALRERALTMARSFDPASVATTTRFLAEGSQPFPAREILRAVTTRTLIVPGIDAQHPAEVAEAYAATLPNGVVADPASYATALVAFVAEVFRAPFMTPARIS